MGSATDSPRKWAQLPSPRRDRAGIRTGWRIAAAAVPAAAHLLRTDTPIIGALATAVTCAWVASRDGTLRTTLSWAVPGAVLCTVLAGPAGGLLVAVAALWAIASWLRTQAWLGHAVGAVLAPTAVSAFLLSVGQRLLLPTLLAVLAGLGVGVVLRRPDQVGRLVAAVDRIGHGLGRVLGTLAMLPATVVVLVGWAWRRLLRDDPLATTGSWAPHRPDRRAERLFVDDGVRPTRARRRRRVALAGALVLALGGAATLWLRHDPPVPTSAAFEHEPRFGQVWAEQQGFSRHVRFDPVTVFRFADYRSGLVNQTDGVRRTWQPPPCDCPRYRVWWFGGSAAWGFFQADMDTIPSALARAAWEQGVALEIENRAAPGYTLGNESLQFASLTATEQPPDLAVFYDGANELDFQIRRNDAGRGTDGSPVSYYDVHLDAIFSAFDRVVGLAPRRSSGSPDEATADDPQLDAPQLAEVSMRRYRQGVDLVERVAASVDTTPLFVWQPTQTTASQEADAPFEPVDPWDRDDREWFRRLVATARAGLPSGAVDLSDVFAERTEPIMPDWPHTNALGAQLVAEALLPSVLASLGHSSSVDSPDAAVRAQRAASSSDVPLDGAPGG